MLRSYVGSRPLADPAKEAALAKAEEGYRFAAYAMLLHRIGTSYEDIRRIRVETPENRKTLAERLGIDLTEPRPPDPADDERNGDELDQLFLHPAVKPPADHLLSEQRIERLFGLGDTTRDPLSEGAKRGDDAGSNSAMEFGRRGVGAEHRPGRLGVRYVGEPGARRVPRRTPSRPLRAKFVASGEIATAKGTVALVPEADTRLTGVFEIAYTGDSAAISLAAVPAFLSWQLKHLRTLWSGQDHPADAYSDSSPQQLPFIDPDLIGPDDFRHPTPKSNSTIPDRAFDIWLERRTFIDATLRDLEASRKAKGLTEILKQVLGDTMVPGNPLPDLDGLLLTLTKSGTATDEVRVAKDSVTALTLSVESFTRLMSIRAKDQLAAGDTRNDGVSEQEWREVYSILTQALKARQYDAWRTAEQDSTAAMDLEELTGLKDVNRA